MSNEKLKELIEALDSLDYIIKKINYEYRREYFYGDLEILISTGQNKKYSFSKEEMIKTTRLVETLFSFGYGIVTYGLVDVEGFGDIRLVLKTL